jgi:hypothetical protein
LPNHEASTLQEYVKILRKIMIPLEAGLFQLLRKMESSEVRSFMILDVSLCFIFIIAEEVTI